MIQTVIWSMARWFPTAAVVYLLSVLLWRRLWRELPFFVFYLSSALLTAALRYSSFFWGTKPYFYTYWITDLSVSLAVLLAIYEVFLRRLFIGFHKTVAYRRIFSVIGAAILVLTVITALQAANEGAAFQMAARAFDFMRTAVLVFFIGLMTLMGRQWTRYDLGIALGFGIQAAAALAAAAVRTRTHYVPTVLDSIELWAYDISCLIWILSFSVKERVADLEIAEKPSHELVNQARTWETVLKNWLSPKKRLF